MKIANIDRETLHGFSNIFSKEIFSDISEKETLYFLSPCSKNKKFLIFHVMELSSSNIKKNLTFLDMKSYTFQPKLKKQNQKQKQKQTNKQTKTTQKNFFCFGKRKPRKNLYFLQKKLFLYFRKRKPWKNKLSYYFCCF